MSDPSERFGAAGTLLHLFSFGLVAVGTAVSFGLASFSVGIGRETCIGGSATKFIYSAIASCTEGHVPIKIDPSSLSHATTPIALLLLVQNPTTSNMLSPEPELRSNFMLLSDYGASAATQDTAHASAIQGPVSKKTLPAELNASQQAVTKATPSAEAASVIVDEERDRLLLASVGNQQPATLDQANKDGLETTSAEQPPKTFYSSYYPLNPKAAFRYRVRKECGPIDDLVLRRDCIASFGVRYPRKGSSR